MSRLIKCIAPALFALAMVGCGPVEVRIGKEQGAKPLNGALVAKVPTTTFQCGDVITAMDTSQTFTVVSRVVSGGCEFTFDDTIEALKASDYESIGELKVASNLVQRIELSINKLTFTDVATGAALDLSTRVTSVVLWVNGQQVADKAALARLPVVVKLEGAALASLKAKVDARQPASVAVKAVAVLPEMPRPPERLKLAYDAQPAIILGPGKIF